MPILSSILEQLFPDDRVVRRFRMPPHIARATAPLIAKLIADDTDGETYRCAFALCCRGKCPPLAIHRGDVSIARIDGPLQEAAGGYLPLGGLIETPGVTVHLTPFEAEALDQRIRIATEREIRAWTAEHDLYGLPPVSPDLDRRKADREARALIARWAAWHRKEGVRDA